MTIEATLSAVVREEFTISLDVAYVKEEIRSEEYDGSYEWTPTDETQVIPIEYKTANRNITINPIPSNYGLITWNGATLTVS